jgi:hypothetical protein
MHSLFTYQKKKPMHSLFKCELVTHQQKKKANLMQVSIAANISPVE